MTIKRSDDGRMRVALGAVELWIVGVVAAAFLASFGFGVSLIRDGFSDLKSDVADVQHRLARIEGRYQESDARSGGR